MSGFEAFVYRNLDFESIVKSGACEYGVLKKLCLIADFTRCF